MVMGKLIGEAEAEPKPETIVQPRRQISGRVLGILIFLFVMAALALAFGFRAELNKLIDSTPSQQTGVGTGKVVK